MVFTQPEFGYIRLLHTEPVLVPAGITVQSLGGSSKPAPYPIAGFPNVTKVTGHYFLSSGGQTITITGHGLADAAAVAFGNETLAAESDVYLPSPDVKVHTDTRITIMTPSTSPGVTQVAVCSSSGCGLAPTELVFGYPGRAAITALAPGSGPASGGTMVTITGRDLDAPTKVLFGSRPAVIETSGPSGPSGFSGPSGLSGPSGGFGAFGAVRTLGAVRAVRPLRAVGAVEDARRDRPAGPGRRTRPDPGRDRRGHRLRGPDEPAHQAGLFRYRASPPSPPQDVQASGLQGAARVTWRPPVVDGGFRVSRYRVSAMRVSKDSQTRIATRLVSSGVRSVRFKVLPSGQLIQFDVTAISARGASAAGNVEETDHRARDERLLPPHPQRSRHRLREHGR